RKWPAWRPTGSRATSDRRPGRSRPNAPIRVEPDRAETRKETVMRLPVDHLRVEVATKACDIPADERARLQSALAALADAVNAFPDPALWIDTVYHPRSQLYHVECKLKLPGRTLFTGEEDAYLDAALQRCARKL